MKRAFALFGLLGVVGCFLPIQWGFSVFDALTSDTLTVAMIFAAFAVPMLIGFGDKLSSAASVVAIGCFGYLLIWKFGFDTYDLIVKGQIGGKAIGFAALGGFVTSILSLAEAKD